MKKIIVNATKIPLNYNDPKSFIVEVEDDEFAKDNAISIVRHELRDLAGEGLSSNYVYKAKEYTPPPKGKIVG